jgi:hypothetical protein
MMPCSEFSVGVNQVDVNKILSSSNENTVVMGMKQVLVPAPV